MPDREERPARTIIGPARLADLREVRRAYQAQPSESRLLYHPFPFGTVRLRLLLGVLWVTGRAGRRWVRWAPRTAAVLTIVRDRTDGSLAGFGTLRFRRDPAGRLVARTGLFVLPNRRRQGVGRALKQSMVEHAQQLGATRVEAFLLGTNRASAELNRSLGFVPRPATVGDPSVAQGLWIAEGDIPRHEPTPVSAEPRPSSTALRESGRIG